jgi:hypothetical protein
VVHVLNAHMKLSIRATFVGKLDNVDVSLRSASNFRFTGPRAHLHVKSFEKFAIYALVLRLPAKRSSKMCKVIITRSRGDSRCLHDARSSKIIKVTVKHS